MIADFKDADEVVTYLPEGSISVRPDSVHAVAKAVEYWVGSKESERIVELPDLR